MNVWTNFVGGFLSGFLALGFMFLIIIAMFIVDYFWCKSNMGGYFCRTTPEQTYDDDLVVVESGGRQKKNKS